MPEGFDPLTLSTADFDLTQDPEVEQGLKPEPEPEPTQPDEPEPEAEADAEAEVTEDADGGALEPEEDLKALGFPELPAELAADEGVSKRYIETQHGIQNILRQQQTVLSDLRKYDTVAKNLENPATAREAFIALADIVKQQTGIDPLERITKSEPVEVPDEWAGFTPEQYQEAKDNGIEYPGEYRAYRKALDRMEESLKPFKEQREQEMLRAQTQAFLDTEAPRVMGFLAKTENGWPVTKEMVAAAYKEFPNLKDDLALAVKRAFPDEFAAHKAQAVLKAQGKEGPELLTKGGSGSKGVVLEPIDIDAPSSELIHKIYANQQALKS